MTSYPDGSEDAVMLPASALVALVCAVFAVDWALFAAVCAVAALVCAVFAVDCAVAALASAVSATAAAVKIPSSQWLTAALVSGVSGPGSGVPQHEPEFQGS